VLAFVLISGSTLAQESDEAALALADRTKTEPALQRPCVGYAEVAGSETAYSDGRAMTPSGRASFDLRCELAFTSGWRGLLAERFDEFWARGSSAQAVNTLKEAYLSFRSDGAVLVDVGRINVRQGVAFAYNPTDYFRAHATRAVISIDPETRRGERLGALMGRFQMLWPSGSLTGIFAPRVDARPNDSTFNPDFGATNASSRWLLIWSQRLGRELQPQILLTGAQHQPPRVGLDLTYLLNRATVAYMEWSGGRSASSLSRSGHGPGGWDDTAFDSQLSAGVTFTSSNKLSLTFEYEYDGTAPGSREWAAFRTGAIRPYVQYRQYIATQGDLATRQNLFGYVHWDDVGIDRLGLTAFVRFDPYDHSRVTWLEARYHWQHAGVAIQWQRNAGDATSDLAPAPVRQSWLALIDYYF
jgi:hypothetical protein